METPNGFNYFPFTAGILTVSSTLTIGTDADLKSGGLNDHAETCGCWKTEDGDLNFAKAFATEYGGISLSDSQRPENRLQRGRELLENMAKEGNHRQNNKTGQRTPKSFGLSVAGFL